jgi:phosphoadenosine phosphosulfate reductase
MTEALQKKVNRAIKLIQQAGRDGQVVEVAYSGGKDSDVILELTKMSGIKYRAIYRNTTIDPPGTIKHAELMGAEIQRPEKSFLKLIEENGFPSRFRRFCCRYLKEYKVLDKCIMGIRRSESGKRAERYKEPTQCRFYGSLKEHVEAFYPLLDWEDEDVAEFIAERSIKCHSLYYDEQGNFHTERRLGCMCCPLASRHQRLAYFVKYPGIVKLYIRGGQKFLKTHENGKIAQLYDNVYDWFVRDVFYDTQEEWDLAHTGLFGNVDSKMFLEDYFKIKL